MERQRRRAPATYSASMVEYVVVPEPGSSLSLTFTRFGAPLPPAKHRAAIQHAAGGKDRRAHTHRSRTARYAVTEFSRLDAPPRSSRRVASAGKSKERTRTNPRTRGSGDRRK